MITFICWKWQSTGWRAPYRVPHVNALYRMLDWHMKSDFRLLCFTDKPQEAGYLKEIDVRPLWKDPKLKVKTATYAPNCYQRLRVFNPEFLSAVERDGSRLSVVASIDLDCLVRGDLTPLFSGKDIFKIVRGRASPYNGSLWKIDRTGIFSMHRPEAFSDLYAVYTDFDPVHSPALAQQQKQVNGAPYFGSDQAWISYKLPDRPTWCDDDGVYQYSTKRANAPLPDDCRVMFFAGDVKPWSMTAKKQCPAIYNDYMQYYRG